MELNASTSFYGGRFKPDTVIRSECLASASNWVVPSPSEIRTAIAFTGYSVVVFSDKFNIPRAELEQWLSGDAVIPYAVWCIICNLANLGDIWRY